MKTAEERRRNRIDKRRREILEAAKAAFLSRRYSQVTMAEIADAADISKATLYLYFRRKASVYGGILAADMQQLADRLEAAYDPGAATAPNLWSLVRAYRGYFDEHPEYFTKLSFFFFPGRERRLTPELAAAIDERLTQAVATIERCLQAGIDRAEVRPQDPWTAAVALWGLLQGTYYLAVTERTRKFRRPLDEILDAGVENWLLGVLRTDKVEARAGSARRPVAPRPALPPKGRRRAGGGGTPRSTTS